MKPVNTLTTLISSILTVMQNVAASLLKGGHAIGVILPLVEVNSTGTTPNPVPQMAGLLDGYI